MGSQADSTAFAQVRRRKGLSANPPRYAGDTYPPYGGFRSAGAFTDVVLQSDGKPVVIAPGNGTPPGFRLFRYLPSSSVEDVSFSGGQVQYTFTDGPGADASLGRSLAIQNGKILAVGEAEWNAPDFDFGLMRLESSPIFADGFATGGLSAWSTVAPWPAKIPFSLVESAFA